MNAAWNRRTFIKTTAGAAAACWGGVAPAQEAYPVRPIQFVLPIPPGGIVDTVARLVTERMKDGLGQPCVIHNKPGGSYVIGVTAAATAPADGYTVLTMHIGVLAAQAAMRQFNLLESFAPVGMIGALPTTVTVGGTSRFQTVADLVQYGRANPGKVNFSTPGLGTVEHLKSVQFTKAAGFQATHIPYKGGPEMVMSLINGDAHFSLLPNALAEPYVAKGQLRYIAPLSDARLPAHSQIATAREQGVEVESMVSWMGFMVRKGTPARAIEVLSRETTRAMQTPEIQDRLRAIGGVPTYTNSPGEFEARMRTDLAWMTRVAKDLDLKVN